MKWWKVTIVFLALVIAIGLGIGIPLAMDSNDMDMGRKTIEKEWKLGNCDVEMDLEVDGEDLFCPLIPQ